MRAFLLTLASGVLATSTAIAATAVTTSNVNLRSGPGTGYAAQRMLPSGTAVEIGGCDEEGAWCSVTADGVGGFVAGRYLEAQDAPDPWPRGYTTAQGAEIVIYQPQVVEWSGFRTIEALVATEVTPKPGEKPIFGVIGLKAETEADQETGEVVISDMSITRLDFAALDRAALADVALKVGEILPTEPITVSLARLTASLENYQRLADVGDLKADPPPIYYSDKPAVLVQTDGEPTTAPVEGVSGLAFVLNSNWDILKDEASGAYFLRVDTSWLTSPALGADAQWTPVTALPALFDRLPDDDNWKDARAAIPPKPFEGAPPRVFFTTTPSEMIVTEGAPQLVAVPRTKLSWIANTTSDLFFHAGDRNYYFLTSGRWFRAAALRGPWTFATPDLPVDFRDIPADAEYGSVRASVPGTPESDEARIRASIPQLARVSTDGSVTATVAYDGDPAFAPIEGTSLAYAENTEARVIRVGESYYVLKDGVWFVGPSPTGPFAVATSVPQEIYTIPPSSPVYDVTYVRAYDTEPDAVWYGYTMGYLGAYLAWDTLVYGSGWYYPPYWGYWGPNRWPIYYSRPLSYGFGAYYNAARGSWGRYGYAYGPWRGIGGGAAWNPATGRYARGGYAYGPNGSAGFVSVWNPRTGVRAGAVGGHNVYGSWGAAGVRKGSDWARVRGHSGNNGGTVRWNTSNGNGGRIVRKDNGDIYAGRDGNVYRRQDGEWQKRSDGGWEDVDHGRRGGSDRTDGRGNAGDRGDLRGQADNARHGDARGGASGNVGAKTAAGNSGGKGASAGSKTQGVGNAAAKNAGANNAGAKSASAKGSSVKSTATKHAPSKTVSSTRAKSASAGASAARSVARPSHLDRDASARQLGNRHTMGASHGSQRRYVPHGGGGGHRGR